MLVVCKEKLEFESKGLGLWEEKMWLFMFVFYFLQKKLDGVRENTNFPPKNGTSKCKLGVWKKNSSFWEKNGTF